MNPAEIYYRICSILPANAFDRNTVIGVFLIGALPAVGGSAASILLNACGVWAALSLATGRFPFQMGAGDRMLAMVFSIYAASVLATALLAERHIGLPSAIVWLLPFLSVWFHAPRLRASSGLDYLSIFCLGASIGAIAAFAVGIVQYLGGTLRPEAGAGNAAVFGMTCLLQGCFSALNITSNSPAARNLAIAGFLAGMLGMLLSQTRGVWIAAMPALLLVFAYAPGHWAKLLRYRPSPLLLITSLTIVLVVSSSVLIRLDQTSRELEILSDAVDASSSVVIRLRLWEASLAAIADSPIWGYGIQNRMLAIQIFYSPFGNGSANYTHPHNMLLAAFLDGGIIVATALLALLVAPILIASRPRHDGRKRLYLAIILVTIYAINGMTQIMFKHDIMDAVFIWAALMVAASGDTQQSGRGPTIDPRTSNVSSPSDYAVTQELRVPWQGTSRKP